MKANADLKRDPSLLGVFGMCLLFAPLQMGGYLLGYLLVSVLAIPSSLAALLPVILTLYAGLPLWIWLMYRYFHQHWRDQAHEGYSTVNGN